MTPQRSAVRHYCMAGAWALLSLYANGASHLSAAKASRAEQEAEKQ